MFSSCSLPSPLPHWLTSNCHVLRSSWYVYVWRHLFFEANQTLLELSSAFGLSNKLKSRPQVSSIGQANSSLERARVKRGVQLSPQRKRECVQVSMRRGPSRGCSVLRLFSSLVAGRNLFLAVSSTSAELALNLTVQVNVLAKRALFLPPLAFLLEMSPQAGGGSAPTLTSSAMVSSSTTWPAPKESLAFALTSFPYT